MALNDDVTVVVPARNRHDMTRRLLRSLAEAAQACQVVLVDDGSDPPLLPLVADFPGMRLRCLRNEQSQGPAVSRNLGLRHAQTALVAFTDNDVVVSPEWLARLHAHMQAAPPDVAGVGGHVADDGTNLVGKYATRLGLLDPHTEKGRVAYLVTANCMYRRKVVMDAGGFDESFVTPGGEDPDLSFRLIRAGYRLEFEPQAVVTHSYSASWRAFWRQFRRYGRGCRKAMEALAAGAKCPQNGSPGCQCAVEARPTGAAGS